MYEILTCSAFLLDEILRKKWVAEGEYLEVHNSVNFTTNYNTPEQRLDRLNRIEQVFKDLNLKYSVYNRGLYLELQSITRSMEGYNNYGGSVPVISNPEKRRVV